MEGKYMLEKLSSRCTEDAGCLIWQGRVDRCGAPYLRIGVRRLMWEALHGSVPADKVVVPDCGRPACLEHLVLTTKADVMRKAMSRPDVVARKRVAARKLSRKNAPKLNEITVAAIRASDKSQRAIAREFNVAQSFVSRIVNNLAWKPITPNFFQGL